MRIISDNDARSAWENFLHDWPEFTRLKISAQVTEHATSLAWELGLRRYDTMHLAAALTWQDHWKRRSTWQLLTGFFGVQVKKPGLRPGLKP
jgi:hypothetical protein